MDNLDNKEVNKYKIAIDKLNDPSFRVELLNEIVKEININWSWTGRFHNTRLHDYNVTVYGVDHCIMLAISKIGNWFTINYRQNFNLVSCSNCKKRTF